MVTVVEDFEVDVTLVALHDGNSGNAQLAADALRYLRLWDTDDDNAAQHYVFIGFQSLNGQPQELTAGEFKILMLADASDTSPQEMLTMSLGTTALTATAQYNTLLTGTYDHDRRSIANFSFVPWTAGQLIRVGAQGETWYRVAVNTATNDEVADIDYLRYIYTTPGG